MSDTQVKVVPPSLLRRVLIRILSIVVAATTFSCVVGYVSREANATAGPAGFGRGLLHGALMPAAMLNLLIGNDVNIYAANNTGRTYKLGYTTGVNACGAVVACIFFWRIKRWRKRFAAASG
jgi:hypothetical protein